MYLTEISIFLFLGLLCFMGLSYIVKHYIRKKDKKKRARV